MIQVDKPGDRHIELTAADRRALRRLTRGFLFTGLVATSLFMVLPFFLGEKINWGLVIAFWYFSGLFCICSAYQQGRRNAMNDSKAAG